MKVILKCILTLLIPFCFSYQSFGILNGDRYADHAPGAIANILFKKHDNTIGICAGTLIDPKWVLTAGHCVDNKKEFHILVGEIDRSLLIRGNKLSDDHPNAYRGIRYIMHPDYNESITSSKPYAPYLDMALLELDHPVQNIDPIELASAEQKQALINASVNQNYIDLVTAGWGNSNMGTDDGKEIPTILQKAMVNLLAQCVGEIDNNFLCTTFSRNSGRRQSSCAGDSGGPLMLTNNQNILTQIGIMKGFTEILINNDSVNKKSQYRIVREGQCAAPLAGAKYVDTTLPAVRNFIETHIPQLAISKKECRSIIAGDASHPWRISFLGSNIETIPYFTDGTNYCYIGTDLPLSSLEGYRFRLFEENRASGNFLRDIYNITVNSGTGLESLTFDSSYNWSSFKTLRVYKPDGSLIGGAGTQSLYWWGHRWNADSQTPEGYPALLQKR